MAIVDKNTGAPIRFENGGKFRIMGASDSYSVLLIEAGTLEVEDANVEGIPVMDRGQLTGTVVSGDERPSTLRLRCKCTKLGMTAATDLMTLLRPADTGQAKTKFDIEIDLPDTRGGSAGTRCTADDCWVPEPVIYRAGGAGQNLDTVEFTIRCENGITWASY